MKKRILYVILIGIINMAILTTGYYFYVQKEIANTEKNYRYIAEEKANNIESTIESVIIRTDALKILLQDTNGESVFFESLADDLYDNVKDETGISLKYISIAPDGVVSDVYPLLTNESLIGYDYLDVTKTGNVTDPHIYEQGKPILTNSYDIKEGGFGVSGAIPVMLKNGGKDSLWGLVGFNISSDSLTEALNLESFEDLGIDYRLSYLDSHNTKHMNPIQNP